MRLRIRLLQSGFTLVEMVIVMAILAVLTFVALRSTTGIIERARYDQTRKVLGEIEEAIIGKQGAGANDSIPYSYIADMGALPSMQPIPNELMDLWVMPTGPTIISNQIITDPLDPLVQLSSGWRGPYLQLPPGAANLKDGFGNLLKVIFPSGFSSEFSVTSLGLDGLPGGTSYDADFNPIIIIDSKPDSNPTKVNKAWAQVSGTVRVATPPALPHWHVVVIAYQPNGTKDLVIVQQDGGAQLGGTNIPFTFKDTTNRLTPGVRAFRAYLYKDSELANFANDPRDASLHGVSGQQSGVLYSLLRSGSNVITSNQELVIP